MVYNPAIHHRRSIRLKGHDYAGGGLYFVTMCAHRDAGHIFAQEAVREMVARIWEEEAGGRGRTLGPPEQGRTQGPPQLGSPERPAPTSFASTPLPYVVMPDHFHALVRIPVGAGLVSAQGGLVSAQSLGDVVCAFKSRVVNAYIARVKAGEWPPFPGKIWQRDYYERIVRNAEAEEKIGGYIRRNPWRCVMDFGNGLRGMGNPTLWTTEKIGVLASRGGAGGHEARAGGHKARPNEARPNGPPQRPERASLAPTDTPTDHPYMSGFHSPMEKEVFALLLARKQPVIWCPAWSLENAVRSPEILAALEENRMLVLEMRNQDGNLAAAEQRNRFVLEQVGKLWLPHVTPGGMLDRLIQELKVRDKILHNGDRSLPQLEGNQRLFL